MFTGCRVFEGQQVFRRLWPTVQVYCSHHKQSTSREVERDHVIEEEDRGHAGEDDGERGGKTLQDVVGIADYQSHDEPT